MTPNHAEIKKKKKKREDVKSTDMKIYSEDKSRIGQDRKPIKSG